MNRMIKHIVFLMAFLIWFHAPQPAVSQGFDDPLIFQGADHTTNPSAASRALGGITVGVRNDAGILFMNPAGLATLKGPQFMVGGMNFTVESGQVQQYAPLKYYSNFSLLMEGLTGYIPDPVLDTMRHNAGDTVQRPFDAIGPNWAHFRSKNAPLQAIGAIPFTIGSVRLVGGAGVTEYANLNHYYQNNNVLSPSIGSERPMPTPLPGTDSVLVQWYQYLRWRDGSIRGYGAAVSVAVTDQIALGLSGVALSGSTTDYEQHTGRGRLKFFGSTAGYFFRLDSVYNHTTWSGTSDYRGTDFTISGTYRGKTVTIGASVKPPMTITRKYSTRMEVDTTGTPVLTTLSGEDKIKLPWLGTLGISIAVRADVMIGLEYEIRSFESAVYTAPDNTTSNPWLSASVYHAGIQYDASSWLALRAGVRGQSEVFEEAGNPIAGDPVSYSIYSAGVGVSYAGARLDMVYEYGRMNYDDSWQTNVNLNTETHRSMAATLSYTLPWE